MKGKPGLEDKEQALIDAALRELKARESSAAHPPQAPATPATRQSKPAVAGGNPPAAQPRTTSFPTTPIDHPTVDGWHHPAAHDATPKVKIAAEEKWTRIAAVMEAAQGEARQARDRMRRIALRIAVGATAFMILTVIVLLR